MKKTVILISTIVLLVSCTDVKESDEYKSLQTRNDKLVSTLGAQNSEVIDYLMDFNTIQQNLNEIKKHERLISINKTNPEGINKREQITNDINTIYNLLKENQEKLKELNDRYRNSNHKNKELEKLIATLNQQISEKNQEIQVLNTELESLNFEIKDLTGELIEVQSENETQSKIIENQIEELHTAYYVIGTSKELQEKKIITKEGGFIGIGRNSKLDNDFNKEYCTEISTEAFDKIAVFSRKAKLVTTHPAGSYEWDETDKKVDNLIINDSKVFWSVSKCLVIEVTN